MPKSRILLNAELRFVIVFLLILCLSACTDQKDRVDEAIILEKMRSEDREIRQGIGYELALMGEDDAVDFLIQTLTDANIGVRRGAVNFLDRYANPRAIDGLTTVFLNDQDRWIRDLAAQALISTDSKYAADLLVEQLDQAEDPVAQEIAVGLLSDMGDKRVIPLLMRLSDDPDTRTNKIVLRLGSFGDKRAVPWLIEIIQDWLDDDSSRSKIYAGRAADPLAQIRDERSIPVLLKTLETDRSLVRADFGPSIAPPLLEIIQNEPSGRTRNKAIGVLRHMDYPQLASTFGGIFLETDDNHLQRAMAKALSNMGSAGAEQLLMATKHKAALGYLDSYNSKEVLQAVAELALDSSYPRRLQAIQTLQDVGATWPEELITISSTLLRDPDPVVRLHILGMLRALEMREARELLQEFKHDPDERVRRAAINLSASFSGKQLLALEIEMDKNSYDYDEPVNMEYRVVNVSDNPVDVCTYLMLPLVGPISVLRTYIINPEIRREDGTLMEYKGAAGVPRPYNRKDHQMLQPGGILRGHIPISKFYHLYKPGRYTVSLRYRPRDLGLRLDLWWWVGELRSNEVSFKVKHPSRGQLREMLASMDIENLDRWEDFESAERICHQLVELQSRSSIETVKKLAFYEPPELEESAQEEFRSEDHYNLAIPQVKQVYQGELSGIALETLTKLSFKELIPLWLELSDIDDSRKGNRNSSAALRGLTLLRHPKAKEIRRRWAFGHRDYAVEQALALKEMGDNSAVEWLKAGALRKLKHPIPKEREKAIRALGKIKESEGLRADASEVEAMLGDPDSRVQRAAAYQLVSQGSSAGIHLIQQDLSADDSKTRVKAREAFLALRKLNPEIRREGG